MNFMNNFALWLINIAEFFQRRHQLAAIYPGFFIMLGIISSNRWYLIIGGIILTILLFKLRHAVAFSTAALLAGITQLLIVWATMGNSYTMLLDNKEAGGEIKVRVTDTTYGGEKIPWLEAPKYFHAEIISVKLTGNEEFLPFGGKIMIRAEEAKPFYGDFLLVQGTFRKPSRESYYEQNTVTPEQITRRSAEYAIIGFDYGTYLHNRGISHIFYANKLEKTAGELSSVQKAYRFILHGRENILATVTSSIKNDENKGMIATLLFGCPQGVSRESKKSFIFSGTIHIFTVSGLHVGIVAMLTTLLLRGLPFRLRYLLIPVAVFIYVAATGMNAPSVRAMTMITVWCVCRAFLLKTPGLNLTFIAASILLFCNPRYIADMGFQYSFITVGFLILSTGIVTRVNEYIYEKQRWIPAAYFTWRQRFSLKFAGKIWGAVSCCIVAWLAGSAIALYYQGIYVPFSVAANLILIPLVWLLYPLTLGVVFIPQLGWLIEFILWLMRAVCDFFYYTFDSTACAKPPLWSLAIFFFALVIVMAIRSRIIIGLSAAVILGLIGYWHYLALAQPPSVMVMHGGESSIPAFIISAPGTAETVMIDVPSYNIAAATGYLLRSHGASRLDKLLITSGLKSHTAGVKKLIDELQPAEFIPPKNLTRRQYLHRLLPDITSNFATASSNPLISTGKNSLRIEYSHGPGFIIDITAERNENGKTTVRLAGKGYPEILLDLNNSSTLKIMEYEFKP